MKRISIFLLFLISLNKMYAQEGVGNIKGVISDIESFEPVSKAEVLILKNKKTIAGTLTDEKGNYLIENIAVGEYTLKVNYFGERHSQPVIVEVQNTISVDVKIPITVEMETVEIFGRTSPFKKQPGTASELSNATLRSINPIGTQEALRYVPGVFGAADDGMGNSRVSIGIRGLSPRRSSKVLLLEDGIPIQPALYVYPNAYYNPPVERIHEIEVIKGSGSIKYGPQTMGGVINYITNKPRREFGGVTDLTFGTNGYVSAYAEVGGWGNKKVNPELQLLYKRGNGFRENNSFDQVNGTLKVNVFFNEAKSLYIKYNINYENTQATYTGLTEYSFRTNPRFNPKEHDIFKVFRTSLDLIYTHHISNNITSTTKVFANIFDREWWRENDVFVNASSYDRTTVNPVAWYTQGDLIRVGNGVNNFGNARAFYVMGVEQSYAIEHKILKTKTKLEIGGRYYWDRFIDDKFLGSSPDARKGVYYIPNAAGQFTGGVDSVGTSNHFETTAFSAYAYEHWNLTEKFSFVPGIRIELFEQEMIDRMQGSKYQDQSMFVALPGVGVNYELGKTNLFAGIHRGYSPPSSSSLMITNFGTANTGFDLLPEKSWNYEVGLRGNFSAVSFETAGFLIDMEDLLIMGSPAIRFKKPAKAVTYGVEHSMKLYSSKWSNFLPDLNLSYTLLNSEIKKGIVASAIKTGDADVKGNELPYAPKHTLSVGLSKSIKEKFLVRADYVYISDVYTDLENIEFIRNRGDTGPVPHFYLIDASMSYKINKHWRVTLTGKNILDKIYIGSRLHSDPYAPVGSQNKANTSSGIIPGSRRQLNLGIRYEF